MTTFEEDTQILQDYIAKSIETLDTGEPVYVKGGYISYNYRDKVLDSNCSTIVRHLLELGYTHTSSHGFGCLDYKFLKRIEL
jgi:hypothetical protein